MGSVVLKLGGASHAHFVRLMWVDVQRVVVKKHGRGSVGIFVLYTKSSTPALEFTNQHVVKGGREKMELAHFGSNSAVLAALLLLGSVTIKIQSAHKKVAPLFAVDA